ncbi:hypothetical protein B0H14DRAFT_1420277 [Mycena olivaceomarginata]|nr:hypothetical protein B0H14DRAFT_1420277 [Mycena olivaceomarginata]
MPFIFIIPLTRFVFTACRRVLASSPFSSIRAHSSCSSYLPVRPARIGTTTRLDTLVPKYIGIGLVAAHGVRSRPSIDKVHGRRGRSPSF